MDIIYTYFKEKAVLFKSAVCNDIVTPHMQDPEVQNIRRKFSVSYHRCNGTGSVDGIATGYGLDGPGIESRRGEIFHTFPDRPWGPPSLLYNGYRVFLAGKERPGRDADPSPPSSAVVMKE